MRCALTQPALLFEVAAPEVERTAKLSPSGDYRYLLGRRWAPEGRTACWIMLNPSTADAFVDDPTILQVIRFSQAWGYQAATVVNLYPFRSSNPADCRRWADWESNGPDWGVRDVIEWNAGIVEEEVRKADLVVAAWGAAPWAQDWAQHLIWEHVICGPCPCPSVYCLGTTALGFPKHPLARGRHRVPREQKPILYASGCAVTLLSGRPARPDCDCGTEATS